MGTKQQEGELKEVSIIITVHLQELVSISRELTVK